MKKQTKVIFILALFTFLPSSSFAQLAKMQALYLYNFTRYVEWPESYKTGDFVIGVAGTGSEVATELKDIATKRKVNAQVIQVVEFKSVKDYINCHLLYIPHTKIGDFSGYIGKTKNSSTLIVTDESALPDGSMINLIFDGVKLKYDVNTTNAKAAGLKVSDKLVAVSK